MSKVAGTSTGMSAPPAPASGNRGIRLEGEASSLQDTMRRPKRIDKHNGEHVERDECEHACNEERTSVNERECGQAEHTEHALVDGQAEHELVDGRSEPEYSQVQQAEGGHSEPVCEQAERAECEFVTGHGELESQRNEHDMVDQDDPERHDETQHDETERHELLDRNNEP